MRYRNLVTGAVLETNSVISGDNWQELAPAGFAVKKEEVAPVQQEAPDEKTEDAPKEEKPEKTDDTAKEPEQEKPAKAKGAVIKPKKGK